MTDLRQERLQPAFDGIDHDSAPEAIQATLAPVLANFLVDRNGRLNLRGPLNESVQVGGVTEKLVGAVAHNNTLLISVKANSATATRDPWVAPYRRALAAADLALPGTTMYHVDLDTLAVTNVTGTAANAPGPRYARIGAFTYALAYAASASSSQNGGFQYHRALLRWDGTAVAPTAYTNGPLMAQDLQAHNERLFVLGGMRPGTTTYKPNSLFWSDPGGPTTDVIGVWQDDVSNLTNEIVVGSDDGADFGVALARIAGGLAILKRHSIYVYRGDSPSEATMRLFTAEQGCLDPRSVVEYEGGCFFLSKQGYMWFDGAQLTNVTQNLRSTLLTEGIRAVGDNGLDGGRASAGVLSNGYIGLSIGWSPSDGTASDIKFCGLYHPGQRAWVSLSTRLSRLPKPVQYGRGLSHSFVLGDGIVVRSNKLVSPELELDGARGFDSEATVFTYDLSGGGPLYNGTGNTLKNQQSGVEAYSGSSPAPIPARWESRLMQLAEPGSRAQLHRLLLDYEFKVNGAIDNEYNGWYVSLYDGSGNVLLPATQLPAQGSASAFKYRRQYALDVFTETNDAQVVIEWTGDNPLPINAATIFNVTLVFQPTRRLTRDA